MYLQTSLNIFIGVQISRFTFSSASFLAFLLGQGPLTRKRQKYQEQDFPLHFLNEKERVSLFASGYTLICPIAPALILNS